MTPSNASKRSMKSVLMLNSLLLRGMRPPRRGARKKLKGGIGKIKLGSKRGGEPTRS